MCPPLLCGEMPSSTRRAGDDCGRRARGHRGMLRVRVRGAQRRERHAVHGVCVSVFGGGAHSPSVREVAIIGGAWCLEQTAAARASSWSASRDGRARAGCTGPRATCGAWDVRQCLWWGSALARHARRGRCRRSVVPRTSGDCVGAEPGCVAGWSCACGMHSAASDTRCARCA